MPEAYDAMAETFTTARNPEKGKPLEHATRLFAEDDGTLALRYHATKVVFFHQDGTYTLANGGWNTITTLQKIRAYTPAKLFSVKGDWYIQLQPDPNDPEPERKDREIPKPYKPAAKFFPGAKPLKHDDGYTTYENNKAVRTYTSPCIAGTREEYSYISGEYKFHGSPPPGAEPNVGQYTGVRTKHGGLYGDYFVWRNGVIAYGDTHYEPYGGEAKAKLGIYTDYKQCPHCKAYDDLVERWNRLMYGDRWGERRFDTNTGWKIWAEMMRRFRTVEAWQQAYLTDLRERRAYLAAQREWDERNRVAFYDGIKIDSNGYALRSQYDSDLKFQRKLKTYERKVEKIRKRIDKYVKDYIAELRKGMPMPGPGDCWYCLMFDAVPPNEPGSRRLMHRGVTKQPVSKDNHEHLLSHLTDRYYVPSLAVNALRERGYQDIGVYMHLDMDPDNNTMGKPDGRYDSVARDIKTYLRKRLVPSPPTR